MKNIKPFGRMQAGIAFSAMKGPQGDPHDRPDSAARRRFLASAAGIALLGAMPLTASAHGEVGPVQPPQSMPAIKVLRHDGTSTTLQALLNGKTTALQLMFTGCSETCPLQGALFSAVQQRIPQAMRAQVQLLSLSIDPLGDDPRALAKWLHQFGAGQQWVAAVPVVKDLDRLRTALTESGKSRDDHTGQIYLFNQKGLLVWRTEDLPPTDVVVRQIEGIARSKAG